MHRFLTLVFLLVTSFCFAQISINGIVIDGQTKETLIGANVIIKGTNNGTATDFNGNYKLTVINRFPFILEISYHSYGANP